jgi:hypothetical protein
MTNGKPQLPACTPGVCGNEPAAEVSYQITRTEYKRKGQILNMKDVLGLCGLTDEPS